MNFFARNRQALWLVPPVMLFSLPGAAQVARGTLNGRVTDDSGAIVVGAQVVAHDNATGAEYKAVSDSAGEYTIPFLNPGTYTVKITYAGFKSFNKTGLVVDANEHVRADAALAVGGASEEVSVAADSPLLETSMASTGQVLDTQDIENIPVNGRTPLILGQLAYGAISTGNPQFNHPFDNSGPSSVSLGGGASKKNEILMDGAPDGGSDGTLAYSPPMDSVAEVKVETFQADAAYGHTSGGTINQLTRSGTNSYHGSLYEYNQISALADTPWFTKFKNQKKSVTRFNQYGGTIGGPLSIPKVYNAKDRLFFFFSFEGIQDNTPSPTLITVPTAAERSGDFSALLNLAKPVVIYDPTTATVQGGKIVRSPFQGNIIPANRLDPVAMKLMSFFPNPNTTASAADGENNYYYPGNSTDSFDSELGRVDVNLGTKNKLYTTFRHNYRYHASGNAFNNIATGSILIQPNWGATVDEVYTFTEKTVIENRVNWTRNTESRPFAANVRPSALGFPSGLDQAGVPQGFPVTAGTKYVDFGYSKGDLIPFDQFQIFSTVSHVSGKHSLAFGTDLRLLKQSSLRFGNSSGIYNFGLTSGVPNTPNGLGWTNGPNPNSGAGSIGQELASLELGLPTSGSFDVNTAQISQAKYLAFFVQDNYRVLPTLTLNLGLRYERDLPTTVRHNESVDGFDTSATSPINAQAQANFAANPVAGVTFPTLKGGLTFASANNPGIYQTAANNFSPRIGFAWTPVAKMSVRGGFGIFNSSVGRVDPIATGFSQTTQMVVSSDNTYTAPAATLSNPFPNGLSPATGSSLGLATYLGRDVSFYPTKLLNDYAERWDLDVQQELPGKVLMELGYVGEHGLHMGINRSLDYVPASYLNVGQARNASVVSNLQASVANPFQGLLPGTTLNGATVARQQLLYAYPQFSSVTMMNYPSGYALFHALQARLEKRMANGVRFLVNYEWSKRLEAVSYLNAQDVRPEKRIGADDRPQHLVISGTYELPFGDHRRFNPQVPGLKYVIGGWDLSEVYTWQPYGPPLSWGDVIYTGPGGNLNNLHVNPHAPLGMFDTSQFDRVSNDQPISGTHIRTLPTQVSNARADGINSMDLSLIKNTEIGEHLRLQLRADLFNALNHPQFSAPTLSPTSSTFGQASSQANLPRTTQLGARLVF